MADRIRANWIRGGTYDSLFILLPPFVCLALIAIFPDMFSADLESAWLWFLLIVCVDVGHVYTTIYRTYMDKSVLEKHRILFYLSPVLFYFAGVILYTLNPLAFWRGMAYLAVYHFIRQQYGFFRLYSRGEIQKQWQRRLDAFMIYSATLYPLLYWHLSGQQKFNWFVPGDFFYINLPGALPVLTSIYLGGWIVYVAKEFFRLISGGKFDLPKNILLAGTALSWYMGIVYFKGDLTFTLLNVVSHGVPYYALVWAYGNKRLSAGLSIARWIRSVFKPSRILVFILFVIFLAYAEEMFWDGFIWKEHSEVFPMSSWLPDLSEHASILALLVPLLALPQLMHYFIDGFIWKIRNDRFGWSTLLPGMEWLKKNP